MQLLVEFKKELKEIQKIRKESVQGTRNEFLKLEDLYNRYFLNFPTKDFTFEELKKEFPTFCSWFPRFEELIKCYEKKKMKVNKIAILYDMVKNVIREFQSEISKFQMIIDACDDDKIKSPINNFDYLLTSLELAGLNEEETCRIFGMFCNYCANYIKKHPDYELKYSDCVKFLGLNAFEKDGNYKLVKNSLVGYALSNIFGDLISASNGELQDSYIEMYNSFIKLSMKPIEVKVEQNVLPVNNTTPVITEQVSTKISRESLDELRKYYKNAELIKVPKDIEMFTKLLDECGIEENEKRYILRLVSNETVKDIKPSVWKYLNDNDKFMYQRAFELLGELHYSSKDYDLLLGIIEEIKYIGDILDELSQEEMDENEYKVEEIFIYAQLDEVLDSLRNILCKYDEEVISENTILFLLDENMVPYVRKDSDLLDGSFYKMVCNGIRKIRKDNQSNFRLVMTNDNISYRVYDILSSKIHLSFIEVDSGIYVLIGCDVASHGYEDIVKRAIYHESEIKELERLVKDENTRNSVLTGHEQYYYLFNRDERDITRKRKID